MVATDPAPVAVGGLVNEMIWAELIDIAVVGDAPVWKTSVPVVSAVTLYAVVDVVDALIVDIISFLSDDDPLLV